MHHRTFHVGLGIVAACLIVTQVARAGDWPGYRGVDRAGHVEVDSGEPALSESNWSPRKLWDRQVGYGCTSPIIAGGKVYVMGWAENGGSGRRPRGNPMGRDTVFCYRLSDGEELWRESYDARFQSRHRTGDTGHYGGPSGTPAINVETGRLFTMGIDGEVRCYDANANGKLIWRVDLHDAKHGLTISQRPNVGKGTRDFGFTGSPLLHDGKVIIEVGAKQATLIALDQADGKPAWKSQYTGPAGHTPGPIVMPVGNREALALLALKELVLIDLSGRPGRTLGTLNWATDFGCNIAAPGRYGDEVLITSGYNHKQLARIQVEGSGLQIRQTSRGYATVATPLVIGDRAFTVDRQIKCTDLKSGRVFWSGGSFGHGSMLAAGDRLLVFGNGRLVLLDPAAGEYRELKQSEKYVRGICYPHVAMAGGIALCKDRDGHLVAVKLVGDDG